MSKTTNSHSIDLKFVLGDLPVSLASSSSFMNTLIRPNSATVYICTLHIFVIVVHDLLHQDLAFRPNIPYPDEYSLAKEMFTCTTTGTCAPCSHTTAYPSPILSDFSCTYARDTCTTNPCGSYPASPASATFGFECNQRYASSAFTSAHNLSHSPQLWHLPSLTDDSIVSVWTSMSAVVH